MEGRTNGDQGRILCHAVKGLDPCHAQSRLDRQTIVLLHQEHGDGKGAHFVLPHIVEAKMQR